MLAACAGCKGNVRDKKHPSLLTQNDAAAYIEQALQSESPDQRRQAIGRLAQTRYVQDDAALEALALIATTDTSQSVRTAAMRAMCRSNKPIVADTALDVLAPQPDQKKIAAPADSVREAATCALGVCAESQSLDADQTTRTTQIGMQLLRTDRSRNVRLAAAQLLGHLPNKDVLYCLADALEQRDFGVCLEAERSLTRLTGQSFDHDAQRWRAFLAETRDPFADRTTMDDAPATSPWSFDRWAWWKKS